MEKLELTFEEAFNELEVIMKKLQADDLPLDDAIELFKKSIMLHELCQTKLTNASKEVNYILEETGEVKEFENDKN
ncbi:MAG: exodeoxyribonuclease VII small subunit [Mycoplasmatales bacterium]